MIKKVRTLKRNSFQTGGSPFSVYTPTFIGRPVEEIGNVIQQGTATAEGIRQTKDALDVAFSNFNVRPEDAHIIEEAKFNIDQGIEDMLADDNLGNMNIAMQGIVNDFKKNKRLSRAIQDTAQFDEDTQYLSELHKEGYLDNERYQHYVNRPYLSVDERTDETGFTRRLDRPMPPRYVDLTRRALQLMAHHNPNAIKSQYIALKNAQGETIDPSTITVDDILSDNNATYQLVSTMRTEYPGMEDDVKRRMLMKGTDSRAYIDDLVNIRNSQGDVVTAEDIATGHTSGLEDARMATNYATEQRINRDLISHESRMRAAQIKNSNYQPLFKPTGKAGKDVEIDYNNLSKNLAETKTKIKDLKVALDSYGDFNNLTPEDKEVYNDNLELYNKLKYDESRTRLMMTRVETPEMINTVRDRIKKQDPLFTRNNQVADIFINGIRNNLSYKDMQDNLNDEQKGILLKSKHNGTTYKLYKDEYQDSIKGALEEGKYTVPARPLLISSDKKSELSEFNNALNQYFKGAGYVLELEGGKFSTDDDIQELIEDAGGADKITAIPTATPINGKVGFMFKIGDDTFYGNIKGLGDDFTQKFRTILSKGISAKPTADGGFDYSDEFDYLNLLDAYSIKNSKGNTLANEVVNLDLFALPRGGTAIGRKWYDDKGDLKDFPKDDKGRPTGGIQVGNLDMEVYPYKLKSKVSGQGEDLYQFHVVYKPTGSQEYVMKEYTDDNGNVIKLKSPEDIISHFSRFYKTKASSNI